MIDTVRDWYGLAVLVLGSGVSGAVGWIIATRTSWFKSETARVEEKTKQQRMQASANAEAAIKRINEGDATAYGAMLEWMKASLLEQSEQHKAVRAMLEETITRLRDGLDRANDEIYTLKEQVAELSGRDQQCQRELGELRVQITQQSMTHREEAGVANRLAEKLRRENKLLRREVYVLGGDPTKTIALDDKGLDDNAPAS